MRGLFFDGIIDLARILISVGQNVLLELELANGIFSYKKWADAE